MPPKNGLKCGEIILQKTNVYSIIYSCRFCEKEINEGYYFIKHMLEHLTISAEESRALLGDEGINALYVVEEQSEMNTNSLMGSEEADIDNAEFGLEEGSNDNLQIISEEICESDKYDEFGNILVDSEHETVDELFEEIYEQVVDSADIKPKIEIDREAYDANVDNVTATIEIGRLRPSDDFSECIEIDSCHIISSDPPPEDKNENNADHNVVVRPLNTNGRTTPRQSTYEKGKRVHKCDFCDAIFKSTSNLRVHRFRHLGIKPYACTMCDKSFSSSTDLKHHIRSHTDERPFVCEDCGLSYRNSAYLNMHRRRHSNNRSQACETCGKRFYEKKTLRDHAISHTNERPYECAECGATFQRRKALVQHEKLHSETKSYLCKICNKAFAQNAGLYSHMKQHNVLNK